MTTDQPPYTPLRTPIDLGHGVVITEFIYSRADPLHMLRPIGLVERHRRPDNGRVCLGSVRLDTPEAREAYQLPGPFWTVVQWDPLTLEPSLLCRFCGNHGFIRDGRWVPA